MLQGLLNYKREKLTLSPPPYSLFGGKPVIETMKSLPTAKLPFDIQEIQIKITDRGCLIEAPLEDNEQIYGFGLSLKPSVNVAYVNVR